MCVCDNFFVVTLMGKPLQSGFFFLYIARHIFIIKPNTNTMLSKLLFILFFGSAFTLISTAQNKSFPVNDAERTSWRKLLNQTNEWYLSDEAVRIADNTMLFQRSCGGWPKNINMARRLSENEIQLVFIEKKNNDATIDNGTTFPQLRYLAKIYQANKQRKFLESFLMGFDYLIEAQYDNGGWPQFYPLIEGYYSHITFNDDAMIGVLELMNDIILNHPDFSFLDTKRREEAKLAHHKGIDLIIKTQIMVNGALTAWCAQYDEVTLKPANARSYELISISGKESISITEFLMKQINPSPDIKNAIIASCKWFEQVKITGHRMNYIPDSTAEEGYNRVLIADPNGSDLWARFYNIETNKPLYVDRGGIICNNYNDISAERRNNYAYIEQFAQKLLNDDFPKWKEINDIK